MKTAFIVWITWQMMIIGYAMIDIENEITRKTYVCEKSEIIPPIVGALIPLVILVPEDVRIRDYCHLLTLK